MKQIHIPIELCQDAIKDNYIKALKLYVCLLLIRNGGFKKNNEQLIELQPYLGYKSIRSVKKQLRILTDKGFLIFNQNKSSFQIRGIDKIIKEFGFTHRNAAIVIVKDIYTFEEFCFSAIVSNLSQYKKPAKNSGLLNKVVNNSGAKKLPKRTTHCQELLENFHPISNGALADLLNISQATVSRYKKSSVDCGYIEIRKSRELVTILKDPSKFPPKALKSSNYIYTYKNKLYHQMPDRLYSHVRLTKRKKMKTY